METFAANLKMRAAELGLSNAEVARRAGLTERRYAHYVSGDREPDLTTLVRIARVLQTSPNALLEFDGERDGSDQRQTLLQRLLASADVLREYELQLLTFQAEAITRIEEARRQ